MITIGVDVGGTFTDLVLLDGRTGKMRSLKTPSTPEGLARGVMNAIHLASVPEQEIVGITHGMTVATNTALEMNGARLGVGMQGLALGETAYQSATAYAKERRSGKSLVKGAKSAKAANGKNYTIEEH